MSKHKSAKRGPIKKLLRVLYALFVLVAGCVLGTGVYVAQQYIEDAPDLDLSKIENQSLTTFFYDSNGQEITPYFSSQNRVWVQYEEMPEKLVNAVIAIEDKRFRKHIGIDVVRIGGAVVSNVFKGTRQGASTITQQLIRNCYLNFSQTYERKIQEMYLAIRLETIYSKDEIFEAYVNTINFSEGNYGVMAAAIDYFGKDDLNDLTLKEIAILASIPNSPSYYNPRYNYYNGKWERNEERALTVLSCMLDQGYITQEEYDAAAAEHPVIREEATRLQMYDHAHYIEYTISQAKQVLIDYYGWEGEDANAMAENMLYNGGLRIYTAMDVDAQESLEQEVYNYNNYPKLAEEGEDAIEAAAVIIDNNTGLVAAMVGSSSEPTVYRSLNRATAKVMTGSSIKPISLYAPLLELGYSPASMFDNVPLPIEGWDSQQAYPSNYGESDPGRVTMRYAIEKSLNITAAQALVELGFDNAYNSLVNFGISEEGLQKTGAGLALGTSGISTLEMTAAYATIANGGIYREPTTIVRIEDRDGNVIYTSGGEGSSRQVISESSAWLLTDMLTTAISDSAISMAKIPGVTVAGKTGTNTSGNGVFFAGYTHYYTSCVWIGHDMGLALDNATGNYYAAPLWRNYIRSIYEKKQLSDAPILDATPEELGITKNRVCKYSGLQPGSYCPAEDVIEEWFAAGTVPAEKDTGYLFVETCAQCGKLAGNYCNDVSRKLIYLLPEDSLYLQLSEEELLQMMPRVCWEYRTESELNSARENADKMCSCCSPPAILEGLSAD